MKKVLIVIDYQKDFVDGALPCGQTAIDIKENIFNKIQRAIDNGDQIIFTMDTHNPLTYADSTEAKLFPPHCLDWSEGHASYLDLYGIKGNFDPEIIEKNTYGSYELVEFILEKCYPFEIEIVGVATNVCVLHNVIMIYNAMPEIPITIDASCCASWDNNLHNQALDLMAGFGINVVGRDSND